MTRAKVLSAILINNMEKQQEQVQEIIDTFSMLESWEDKYRYLIDLGRELPPLDDSARILENKILGCQSNVWIIAVPAEKEGHRIINFIADSDSKLVCGLIAVLRRAYSGQTPQYIMNYDVQELFKELQLEQHLTLGRRNGLAGMVLRIQHLAASQLSVSNGHFK